MRGAWIEIRPMAGRSEKPMSLPMRGAWIEICFHLRAYSSTGESLPTLGAWIENSATSCPLPKKIIRIFRIIFLFRYNPIDFYTDCGIMLA